MKWKLQFEHRAVITLSDKFGSVSPFPKGIRKWYYLKCRVLEQFIRISPMANGNWSQLRYASLSGRVNQLNEFIVSHGRSDSPADEERNK